MSKIFWSNRTALLRCDGCSHSSLVEMKGQNWLVKLICYAMKETRIRAKCSNCGGASASLYLRRADNPLLQTGLRLIAGAARGATKAGIAAKE